LAAAEATLKEDKTAHMKSKTKRQLPAKIICLRAFAAVLSRPALKAPALLPAPFI
jgi:hypothetical protein